MDGIGAQAYRTLMVQCVISTFPPMAFVFVPLTRMHEAHLARGESPREVLNGFNRWLNIGFGSYSSSDFTPGVIGRFQEARFVLRRRRGPLTPPPKLHGGPPALLQVNRNVLSLLKISGRRASKAVGGWRSL